MAMAADAYLTPDTDMVLVSLMLAAPVLTTLAATAMELVLAMDIWPSNISLACTVIVLVAVIAIAAETYLVAATAMVDWSKISNWAFDITEAPTAMELVALMATLGSNVPLE